MAPPPPLTLGLTPAHPTSRLLTLDADALCALLHDGDHHYAVRAGLPPDAHVDFAWTETGKGGLAVCLRVSSQAWPLHGAGDPAPALAPVLTPLFYAPTPAPASPPPPPSLDLDDGTSGDAGAPPPRRATPASAPPRKRPVAETSSASPRDGKTA